MSDEEIREKIEQISATIGLDFEDEVLSDDEKDALLKYAFGEISRDELIEMYEVKRK